jgi:hypothetical protein
VYEAAIEKNLFVVEEGRITVSQRQIRITMENPFTFINVDATSGPNNTPAPRRFGVALLNI